MMIQIIKNPERHSLQCSLKDFYLVDTNIFLHYLFSKNIYKKMLLREREKFLKSSERIEEFLSLKNKQTMCFTSVVWNEICCIVENSKEFSREKLNALEKKMRNIKKDIFRIIFPLKLVWKYSNSIFKELEQKLASQSLTLNIEDRSLVHSSIIMGIPTILTYDEHFFRSQKIIKKIFQEWELKKRKKL